MTTPTSSDNNTSSTSMASTASASTSRCPFAAVTVIADANESPSTADSMSYGDYLSLAPLLAAQHPLSNNHDEMLFIIQHQTSELWLKLVLHELHAALKTIQENNLNPAFKILARVSRIFEQLVQAWNVLATMTPSEYTAMRPSLGSSSGFQSYQYRYLEFILGNKNVQTLQVHQHRPDIFQKLKQALDAPSLYDEIIALLARRGFTINPQRLRQTTPAPTVSDSTVEDAWREIYLAPSRYWDLYQLAEKLIDIEDTFRQWRFRHATTVERIIGMQAGTGGTDGVHYLRKMLDVVLFPEVWTVRTTL